MKNVGLYIHIPFCKVKCKYCDFCSFATKDNLQTDYLQAIDRELEYYTGEYNGLSADTVYIGGGTPTMLKDGNISKLFTSIRKHVALTNDCEITMEANPESLVYKISEMVGEGVNRVSIGIQSLNDRVLDAIGRIHDRREALVAVDKATRYFDNVSADIMLGLPEDSMEIVEDTLDTLLQYPIKHLSAYGLKVEKGTQLYRLVKQGLVLPNEDIQANEYDMVKDMIADKGMLRYEVSNFALPDYESKHNMKYWTRDEYLGIGVASHSMIDNVRYNHHNNLELYIKDPLKRTKNKLAKDDIVLEYIMLGLRTDIGVDLNKLRQYDVDVYKQYAKQIDKWKDCLNISEGRLSIKDEYMYCMNSIMVDFI